MSIPEGYMELSQENNIYEELAPNRQYTLPTSPVESRYKTMCVSYARNVYRLFRGLCCCRF